MERASPWRRRAARRTLASGMGKVVSGIRTAEGCIVTVDGAPLPLRLDLRQYAMGFEWGYDGTGPKQLALAILSEHYGKDEPAVADAPRLLRAVIEDLPAAGWTLTGEEIDRALAAFTQVPTDLAGLLARLRGEG